MLQRLRTLPVLLVVVLASLFVGGASPASATTIGFSNVAGQGGVMSVGVWGTYGGAGPITLTLTSDVPGTKVVHVSGNINAKGSFYLLATGLNAGTAYHIRLDSPTATYTSLKTYKTRTRKVIVDYDRVDVYNDADAWPRGCGDFRFSFATSTEQPITTLNSYCLSSGQTGYVDDMFGRWVSNDVKKNRINDNVYAFDDDVDCSAGSSCYDGCTGMFTGYTACGDIGIGHRSLDVTNEGTHPLFFLVEGTLNPMRVVFVGTLTVSYS
jgi:hypothetical protein